jgi:hypothetical protein
MINSARHHSLIECQAYVRGISESKIRTFNSAKALPN